jgi:hypothetical protein
MTKVRRLALLLLLFAAFAAATAHVLAQAQERSLFASILDAKGAPVDAVDPSDLVVREDKVVREILRVAPSDEPMQIALLVDNSAFAEPLIRDFRQSLPAFISAVLADPKVRGKHQISIVTMAERPTINTDYSSDESLLLKGAGRVFSMSASGTYLLDAITEVSQGIAKRGAVRPVIVVVTAEGQELSYRLYQEVLSALKVSGAQLHVMTVGLPRNFTDDRSIVIAQGPRDSGGSYDNILTGMALTGRMKQLAAELTGQWRVTYARPETLIPPESVTVSAAKPGLTVRGTAAVVPLARKP